MVKKYLLFILITLLALTGFAQNEQFLTNQEKAYMYHIVMKSPALNRNMEYIFDYSGPKNDKDSLDYVFIEEQILKEPTYLSIDFEEFKSQSSGVIAELAVKMALWTLYKELKIGVNTKLKEDYPVIFQDFLDSLTVRVPKGLLVTNRDKKDVFPKRLFKLLNPNLTYNKRKELIGKVSGLTAEEEKQLMDGIHETIKEYTDKKSKDVYRMLGMINAIEANFLLAAGDGSGTAGLLGEKEKDNVDEKGVPIGVGLFTYKTKIETEGKKQVLYPLKEPKEVLQSFGKGIETNIHLSMWGFNYTTQTTVAVTKGDNTYLLYGSKYTGELSPDPAFNNNEKTYKNHLVKLKTVEIPEWELEVFGEKGLEEKIKQLKIDKDALLLAIKKNEYKVSMYRLDQKKNNRKIKKLGGILTKQHAKLSAINKVIEVADEEFYEGKLKLDGMKYRLATMERNLGYNEQPFKSKNHLVYEFEDGTIFNIKTQDLIFKGDDEPKDIQVQLLAVGSNPMSFFADEVQLNIAVTEINKKETLIEDIELVLVDGFKSDRFRLNELVFGKEADYLFTKLTHYLVDNDLEFKVDLKGYGIGEQKGVNISPIQKQTEGQLKTYPGETKEAREEAKESPAFKDLRVTKGSLRLTQKTLALNLVSYTDPVKSNVYNRSNSLTKFGKQHPDLTGNQALSGLRSFGVYDKLIKKMADIADEHLKNDREKQKKYKAFFNQLLDVTPVLINDFRLEYDVYKKG